MRDLKPMKLTDLDGAPFVVSTTAVLPAPVDAVWDELADPSGWFPLMKSSSWHGRVGGVGAVREVSVRTFGVFMEEMLAWDVGRRVAFTMTATSSPLIARMSEEMVIAEVPGGTELRWRMAAKLTMRGKLVAPVLRPIIQQMNKRAAKRLGRCAAASGKARGTHAS